MSDRQQQLIEFHLAMGQPIEPSPTVPSDERVRLRAKLIAEEFFETMEAMFSEGPTCRAYRDIHDAKVIVNDLIRYCKPNVDLVELADGLADLDYVVEGTRLEFGIDGDSIAEEVHKSNMRKVDGPLSPEGKKLKPPGWTLPRIAELIEQQKRPESLGALGDYVANYKNYHEWLAKQP